MKEAIIELIAAFLGSLGFSLVFGMHKRYLLPASLGGILVWGAFVLLRKWIGSEFLPCLLASGVAVLWSELLARRMKTPATVFVIPAILPLVPGGSLYYAMSCAVRGELSAARVYGTSTLLYALAIAAGISLVLAIRELQTKR